MRRGASHDRQIYEAVYGRGVHDYVENNEGSGYEEYYGKTGGSGEMNKKPSSSGAVSELEGGFPRGSIPRGKGGGSDILHLPELLYLGNTKEEGGGDPSVIDVKHDPLGVVQKLLDSAESCTFSTAPEERGPLLSTCLALAVKSGRLSLLAQVASVLFSEHINSASMSALHLGQFVRKQ